MSRIQPVIISLSYNGASITAPVRSVRMLFRVPRPVTAGWRIAFQPAYQDAEDATYNTTGVTATNVSIGGHLGAGRSKGRLVDVPGGASVDLSSGQWVSAKSTTPLWPGVEYVMEFVLTIPSGGRVAGGSASTFYVNDATGLDTRDGTRWSHDYIGPLNTTLLAEDDEDRPLIAGFGDSNTAGTGSGYRWMDSFAQVFNERDDRAHVIPLGYTGEMLDEYDRNTPKFTRTLDLVNAVAGTSEQYAGALINLGTNDINVYHNLGAPALLASLDNVVTRARAVIRPGGPVYVVTIPPMGYDPASTNATTASREAVRVAYNESVRGGGHGDGFIDLDMLLRDTSTPYALAAKYRHLDQVHYTRAGHEALADALDPLVAAAIA